MGARKIEKFPVQVLSLDAIRVDHGIQSRVKMSTSDQHEFSEAMLQGETFPPVVVFFDGRIYWLADGFHRHAAARLAARVNPHLKGIKAEIRDGSKRDAMIYSAGANKKFSIPRTPDDKRRAVRMLLADDEWFMKSNAALAKHAGVKSPAIAKFRGEYCAETGRQVPDVVNTSDGHTFTPRRSGPPRITAYQGKRGNPGLRVCINGKQRYLGTDRLRAEEIAAEIQEKEANPSRLVTVEQLQQMTQDKIVRRGLACRYPKLGAHLSLSGLVGDGWVAVFMDGHEAKDLQLAIGRAELLSVAFDGPKRRFVVSRNLGQYDELIGLGKLLGVEFLTPEELVASINGEEPPPSPDS